MLARSTSPPRIYPSWDELGAVLNVRNLEQAGAQAGTPPSGGAGEGEGIDHVGVRTPSEREPPIATEPQEPGGVRPGLHERPEHAESPQDLVLRLLPSDHHLE